MKRNYADRMRDVKTRNAKKMAELAKEDAFSSFTVQTAVETAIELGADKLELTTAEALEMVKNSDALFSQLMIGQASAEILMGYASKIENVARYLQSNPEMWTELVNR